MHEFVSDVESHRKVIRKRTKEQKNNQNLLCVIGDWKRP